MGHFRARARDTRGSVDKNNKNNKKVLDKWGKV